MKNIIILVVTLVTLSLSSMVNAANVQKYQAVTVEINGNIHEISNTSKEVFDTELKGGVNKIKVISIKTDEELKQTSFEEALMDGDYYIILSQPSWYGEKDEVMEEKGYIINLN